jgi:predicted lipoprotein with Yx(FWY)xxD motif
MVKKFALAGTVAVSAVLLTACGSGSHKTAAAKPAGNAVQQPQAPGGISTNGQQPAAPDGQSAPSAAPAPPNWKGSTVITAVPGTPLGTILTDAAGKTLYRFDKDTAHPSVSNCVGACAKVWPPLKWTKHLKLTGVDAGLVASIMTKDGICQATLNGWPLYTYSKDTAPGQTNGEGVGGTWFASSPTGGKDLPSASAPSNGGYSY